MGFSSAGPDRAYFNTMWPHWRRCSVEGMLSLTRRLKRVGSFVIHAWFRQTTLDLRIRKVVDHAPAQCYDRLAKELEAIAGGLDPSEESPNSTEHAAG